MSKKERLDKIKAKQDAVAKAQLEAETLERQAASQGISKSGKKMLKKAQKEKKHNHESVLFLLLKIIMLVPLAISGLYYGGITVLGVLAGYMNDMPKWIAGAMGIGVAVIIAGVILAFCKKYLPSFILVAGGTISYMRAATYIVGKISDKLENYSGANPELMDMDSEYMLHYYPILITLAISLILTIIWAVKFTKKRKKLKQLRDNAPVESIINS